MKAFFRRAAALLCALSLLSGCTLTERLDKQEEPAAEESGQAAEKNKDYFGLAYYTGEKVNPVLSVSQINRLLAEGLYEGLFVLDNSFKPQPVLCESYTGDGTTYTFTLKSDVTFWSGDPLCAEDVIYSYQTALVNAASPYRSRLAQVQSMTAPTENTVQIVLSSPNTLFPTLLDIPIFRKGTEQNTFSDGTGPYQPQSDGATRWLIPYANWHGGVLTAFDHIDLINTARSDAVVYSFETGDVSLTRAARVSTTPATFKGAVEVFQTPSANLHYMGVNYAKPPYQVAAVRQAISTAFDRTRLCATQLQSFGDPALLPVNPQPVQSGSFAYSMEPDGEKALALLASVGVTDTNSDGVLDYAAADGKRTPLTPVILVNAENSFKVAVTKQIIAELEQIGIRATMSALPFAEYEKALAAGTYDLYYGETAMFPDFDPRPLIGTNGALNYGACANPMTDGLIAQARAAAGDARVGAQQNFYQQFLNTMPIIPIAFARGQVIARGGLISGFTPAPYAAFNGVKHWKAG